MLNEQEISILKMVEERKVPVGNKEISAILKELKTGGYVHYPANKGWQLTEKGTDYLLPVSEDQSIIEKKLKLTRKELNKILWDKHLEEWRSNQ